MDSWKVYKFGFFAAFVIVLMFGLEKHSFFECLFGGFLVGMAAILPSLLLSMIIGEELGAIAYVILVIFLGIGLGRQSLWQGTTTSDDDCGRFGNERCY